MTGLSMSLTLPLTDRARDIISLVSIAITIVGFILTVASLWYAIQQIRKTKTAAEAASEAANRAVRDSETLILRFAIANAVRFLAEVRLHLEAKAWSFASLRAADLADQIAQLARNDGACRDLVQTLRVWESTFRKLHRGDGEFNEPKWLRYMIKIQTKLDQLHTPFQHDEPET